MAGAVGARPDGIGRPEEGDDRRSHRRGKVHGAGVGRDDEGRLPIEAGQLPERRPAAEIDGLRFHPRPDPFERTGFTARQDNADPQFLAGSGRTSSANFSSSQSFVSQKATGLTATKRLSAFLPLRLIRFRSSRRTVHPPQERRVFIEERRHAPSLLLSDRDREFRRRREAVGPFPSSPARWRTKSR